MLLWDFVNQYYLIDHPELARGTRQNINATIRTLEKFLQRPAMLADLDKRTLYAFMAWCADSGLAPKTINNKRGDLISLWYCAEDANLLTPPPRIKKRREPERMPVVWSMDEMKRLYESTNLFTGCYHGVPRRIIMALTLLLLWDSGARIGTLYKANLSDVNRTKRTWHVPAENTKGRRRDRIYRLRDETIAVLESTIHYPRKELVPLPRDKNTRYDWLSKLLILSGLPNSRMEKFHCFRRSAETHAAAAKGISWAAEAIGHTEAVARKHYINTSYLDTPALMDALPSIISK